MYGCVCLWCVGVHRGGASLAESSDGGDEEEDEDMGSAAVRLGTGSSNASAASGTGDDCGSGMFAGQQGEQGPGGGGGKGGSGKGGKSVRVKNLDKVPQDVIRALDQQMAHMPPWDTRITREKLLQLGGVIMGDSSPVRHTHAFPNIHTTTHHRGAGFCYWPGTHAERCVCMCAGASEWGAVRAREQLRPTQLPHQVPGTSLQPHTPPKTSTDSAPEPAYT